MKKASLSIKNLLSKNGYPEKIIEEIHRWYGCAGANNNLKENHSF